tara:strand:- start:16 stop:741 length:726 start_codon:yes stop_codon:yes gene_type:complete
MSKSTKLPFLKTQCSLKEVFPTYFFETIVAPNMGVGSDFFGNDPHHEDLAKAQQRLDDFQQQHPNALLANGYLETRSFYNTKHYKRTTNLGVEFRNVHLGTDFWLPAETPVHAPLNGEVVIAHDNNFHKDYGPLIVLKHSDEGHTFFTLYGHLSRVSLQHSPKGKKMERGDLLGWIGNPTENGNWVPHVHFQIATDLLQNSENFPGVAFASELAYWTQLCPNPNHFFKEYLPSAKPTSYSG